jgi:hypothetical protein
VCGPVEDREDVSKELKRTRFIPANRIFLPPWQNPGILSYVIFEWLLKGIVIVVLGLLDLLGWKRAGMWMDKIVGEGDKEEKPVI